MSLLSPVLAQGGAGTITIGDPGGVTGWGAITDLGTLISAGVGIAFLLAGVLVFVMLIWGGIQWITSGGDKEKTQSARDRITHALVGLAIIAGTWAVITIVENFFGIQIIGTLTLPTAY